MTIPSPRTLRVPLRLAFAAAVMSVLSCGPGGPVGVAGLPPVIKVIEWPFWIDIPMETKDYDRIWRLAVEVVSDRNAIAVMDKESGYLRTEWRTNVGRSEESRYTLRIRTAESKIRMGIEVRQYPSGRMPTELNNRSVTPWTAMYNELRDRLAVAQ